MNQEGKTLLRISDKHQNVMSTRHFGIYRICAKSLINARIDVISEATDQLFELSICLLPYFVYASCECYGETAHMVFTALLTES